MDLGSIFYVNRLNNVRFYESHLINSENWIMCSESWCLYHCSPQSRHPSSRCTFFSLHVKVGCAIYLIKKKALLLRKYLVNACCVTFSNKGCIYEEIIRFRWLILSASIFPSEWIMLATAPMPASVTTLECFLTYSCGFKCKYIHHGHESHCDFGLLMISFGRLYIQLYDSSLGRWLALMAFGRPSTGRKWFVSSGSIWLGSTSISRSKSEDTGWPWDKCRGCSRSERLVRPQHLKIRTPPPTWCATRWETTSLAQWTTRGCQRCCHCPRSWLACTAMTSPSSSRSLTLMWLEHRDRKASHELLISHVTLITHTQQICI